MSPEEKTKAKANNFFVDKVIPGGWDGHVIVVAQEGDTRFLLDSTMDQVVLGEITFPSDVLLVPFVSDIPTTKICFSLDFLTDADERIKVEYFPSEDLSFVDTLAWELDEPMQMLVSLICLKMQLIANRRFEGNVD